MRVAIHQPQFMPWLGYLDKIDRADVFVVLDSVQFKKNEWQNRNRIRTATGWQWVTVPVHHNFGQAIQDVRINNTMDWQRAHLRALAMHYGRAPYVTQFLPELTTIYNTSWDCLSDLAVAMLRWLMSAFGMTTPIEFSSKMTLRDERTERLIDICHTLGATTYVAGAGGKAYMDLESFDAAGVVVEFQDFQHPVYPQCYEPFISGMGAIDVLMMCGDEAGQRLREGRKV